MGFLGNTKDANRVKQGQQAQYLDGMKRFVRKCVEAICWPLLDGYGYPYGNYSVKLRRVDESLQFAGAVSPLCFLSSERGLFRKIALFQSLCTTTGNRQL